LAKKKHPGERLKAVITEELGISYAEFGRRVAAAETPPRKRPYGRNNVGEWTSGRSGIKPKTWAAIEAVTGRSFTWFLHGIAGERTFDRQLHEP
jgi:hypothetical protein